MSSLLGSVRSRDAKPRCRGVGVYGCSYPLSRFFVGFGLELAAAALSVEEEAQLDVQSRAALASARQVQQFEATAAAEQPSDFQWIGFGLELADAGLSVEEEAELDVQSQAALMSARVLRARVASPDRRRIAGAHDFGLGALGATEGAAEEMEAPLDAPPGGRPQAKRVRPPVTLMEFGLCSSLEVPMSPKEVAADGQAGGPTAARGRSEEELAWLGFGLELFAVGLSAEEEAQLDDQSRAALFSARQVCGALTEPDDATSADADEQFMWLGWGLELVEAGLGTHEEAELDAHSRAALAGARLLQARRGASHRIARADYMSGLGLELLSTGFTTEEEAALDSHSRAALATARVLRVDESDGAPKGGSSWLPFGLELDGLELDSDSEAALDAPSRSALTAARVMKEAGEGAPADTTWLSFGMELAGCGLEQEEEAALDGQARAALAAARVAAAAGKDSPAETSWVAFGLEVAGLGLAAEEEAALDAPSRSALAAARVIKEAGKVAPADTTWLSFGMELAGCGLEQEEEAALDGQARAALAAARVAAAAGKDSPAETSWVAFGLEVAGLGLAAEEEAALDAPSRSALAAARVIKEAGKVAPADTTWLSFGMELAGCGLRQEEEAALDGQARAAMHACLLPSVQSLASGVPAVPGGTAVAVRESQPLDLSYSSAGKPSQAPAPSTADAARGGLHDKEEEARTWLSIGRGLVQLGMPPAATAQRTPQERAAMQAARLMQAREDEADERYAWVGFGLELLAASLTPEEEARLDARSLEALESARVLDQQKGTGGGAVGGAAGGAVGSAGEEDPTQGDPYPADPAKEDQFAWLGFGLEMAERGLTEEQQTELGTLPRAALEAARILQGREGAAAAGKIAPLPPSRRRPHRRCDGEAGLDAEASLLGFGFVLADLLPAGDEAQLESATRAALARARELQLDPQVQRRERGAADAFASWNEDPHPPVCVPYRRCALRGWHALHARLLATARRLRSRQRKSRLQGRSVCAQMRRANCPLLPPPPRPLPPLSRAAGLT